MEIHLAVLDGIKDRYETPYFDNLKQYAQRPIGTFHALPIARGKSIFKSNWIRDMGEFYGANLFLAESSATTGGLVSLTSTVLEATGTNPVTAVVPVGANNRLTLTAHGFQVGAATQLTATLADPGSKMAGASLRPADLEHGSA